MKERQKEFIFICTNTSVNNGVSHSIKERKPTRLKILRNTMRKSLLFNKERTRSHVYTSHKIIDDLKIFDEIIGK